MCKEIFSTINNRWELYDSSTSEIMSPLERFKVLVSERGKKEMKNSSICIQK